MARKLAIPFIQPRKHSAIGIFKNGICQGNRICQQCATSGVWIKWYGWPGILTSHTKRQKELLAMLPRNVAAWIRAPKADLEIDEAPYNEPGPGEILIKVS